MKWLAGITVLLLGLGTAERSHACACCAEPGEIQKGRMKVDAFIGNELRSIRFGSRANLYTTAAGWDDIRGIESPDQMEAYRLRADKSGRQWVLSFTGGKRNAGTLSFRLPERIELYAVDTTPQIQRSTKLRKEWRIDAEVAGTGIFAAGLASGNPRATLVLHGKGNACTDATQFKYWTLDVKGGNARYRFFGKLKAPGS